MDTDDRYDQHMAEVRVPAANGHQLRSLSIAARVLDAFIASPTLGPSEVARIVGIAKSSAHRTLNTLADCGLLDRFDRGQYRLGLKMLEFGQITAARYELRAAALPHLAAIHDSVNATVQLGIPGGAQVHYIERFLGPQHVRLTDDAYRRVAAHASSSGKAIAAHDPEFASACLAAGLVAFTGYTIVEPARFLQTLEEVRLRGWATSREEAHLGSSSVAAPILVAPQRRAVAALSVVGPTERVLEGHEERIATLLLRATADIGRRLSVR
jgi:DNA-binding IclR family transcriptional regulator